jgi:hypothetical protein
MDAMKKAILNMWNKGFSGPAIAQKTGKTRSAVMGIIFRHRQHNAEGVRFCIPKMATTKKSKPKNQPKSQTVPKISISKVRIPLTFEVPTPDKNIRITDLGYNSCRYLVTESTTVKNTFYCGHPKERGAYCAYHAQLCYTPIALYKRSDNHDFTAKSRFTPRHP